MNNFYNKCNLPFDISCDSYKDLMDGYKDRTTYSGPIPISKENYNRDLIDFLKRFNIIVTHACIFYTPPNYKKVIHLDGSVFDDHCKLNWVFGPAGIMRWWEPRDYERLEKKYTKIGTDYIFIEEEYCNIIFETAPSGANLVNAGQLHSVENDSSEERWCLSHVLYDLSNSRLLKMETAIELFSRYIEE